MKYNKILNDVLNELKTDSGLITKTKLYKEDLLDYRNTYDKYDDVDIGKMMMEEK